MKYLKMLGLTVTAAMALAAFLGTAAASATVLCKTASNPCPVESRYPAGTAIDASLTSGTSMIWESESATWETCTGSTLSLKSAGAGGSALTVPLGVEGWTFIACTHPASLTSKGEMEVHWITGTNDGVLTAKGTSGSVLSCNWSLKEWTQIGIIKGGNPATIEVTLPVGLYCYPVLRMTARYTINSPKPLYVAGS